MLVVTTAHVLITQAHVLFLSYDLHSHSPFPVMTAQIVLFHSRQQISTTALNITVIDVCKCFSIFDRTATFITEV